jgi:hypothetical protein
MRRSSVPARLITIVIALVLAPIGVGLLSTGGRAWMLSFFRYARTDIDLGQIGGPILLQVSGILLLILVVLTGIWSSAGLLSVGALALIPFIFAVFPAALMGVQRAVRLPLEVIDTIIYGVPLLLFAVLGTMGLVIALVRRRPEPKGTALGVVGIILAPILLAGGAWLLAWGLGRGTLTAFQRFDFDLQPDAAAAVVVGIALVVAGVGVTRWSPFALVLPAVALVVLSILIVLPGDLMSVFFRLPRELSTMLPSLLLLGAGTASALLYLAFTAVLLRVRAQARLAPATPAEGPTTGYPPQQDATYPPSPAQYFPGTGVGPGMQSPGVPPYPPAPGA